MVGRKVGIVGAGFVGATAALYSFAFGAFAAALSLMSFALLQEDNIANTIVIAIKIVDTFFIL